ncbi:MAG: toprim domain-containing protein [Candidatus Bathyarchaeota archaeon]|nr:toprim domain-containing protein [Candidatus Bathyarchaeota archaeon]
MSDKLRNRFEKILQLLEQLVMEAAKDTLIVVEGQNDIEALKELKVKGNIISVKTAGKSFLDILMEIEEQNISQVILLLDFDRRGREWAKRLKQSLEEKRIKVNINFWNKLHALAGRNIKDVEGLPAYLETLRKRIGN